MLTRLETDEDLLSRFAQGEEHAFEVLYKRHRRRLWGMAKKMGWDVQQAEDILVEAMAAVALQARRGGIQGSFIGYALTAVHHRGLHVLERSNERRAHTMQELDIGLQDHRPGPEEALQRDRTRAEVARALDELPGDEGIAIWLVECQGLTYKEAAVALSCSEATIKRRLRSARVALAERLGHLRPGAVAHGEVG